MGKIKFDLIKDFMFRRFVEDDGTICIIAEKTGSRDHQAYMFRDGHIEWVYDVEDFISYILDTDEEDFGENETEEAKVLLSELGYFEEETYESKDGIVVYEKSSDSHSHRPDLNKEVIGQITIGDHPFIRETVDLGRVIGFDHLVETTPDDQIVMFDRGRGYESRMVLNRKPEATSKVTCIIAKAGPEDGAEWDGKYVLITLFEGNPGMPESVGRNKDNPECIKFWENHTLVPTDSERKMMM